MAVLDNPVHSGNTLSVAFWFRADMATPPATSSPALAPRRPQRRLHSCGGRSAAPRGTATTCSPSPRTRFRSVNRRSASTTPVGQQVDYQPEGGLKPGEWYLIAGIIDLEGQVPSITIIGISRKYTALTGAVEYTHLTKTVNFTGTQGSIVGDAGVFLAGPAETETWPANLVVDLDNVCVWSAVKEVATIRIMLEETSTSQGDFATGLVSQFVFDDGGVTAEDIIVQEDWWTKWRHAGVMTETGPGLSDAIGRGMILDSSLANLDSDKDHDGLPDDWEIFFFGHLGYSGSDDPDGDGLTNKEEYDLSADYRDPEITAAYLGNPPYGAPAGWVGDWLAWLNPAQPDTDGDSMPDGWEHRNTLNPLDPSDAEEDPDETTSATGRNITMAHCHGILTLTATALPDGWKSASMSTDVSGAYRRPVHDPLNPDAVRGGRRSGQ